jgi:hypothetical protein
MEQLQEGLPTDTPVLADDTLVQPSQDNGGFDVVPETQPVAVEEVLVADTQDETVENTEAPGIGYLPPSVTTQQDHEVFQQLDDWKDSALTVVGLADTRERTREAIQALPNVDPTTNEAGREWADYMQRSLDSAVQRDQWRGALDRVDSAWRQQVDSERGPIRMGAMGFNNVEGGRVSGEKAVIQVRALVGLGNIIQVPLWHSGFHFSVKAPSDTQMIELNRRLLDEKIVIGRTTNGLAFANTSSYLTQTILDFVMEHMYDTSLQEKDPDVIRSMIQVHDLPLLFWGLACSVWPRGFQYARPYIDPISKAEKILKERLMVSKLLWVDTKAFTLWQVRHMANKLAGSMSTEMVKRYRADFTIGQPRKVELTKDLAITLHAPSAIEYVMAGSKWTAEITKTVDDSFSAPVEDDRRANFIVRHGQATAMRQYTHWVKLVHARNSFIDDREDIEKVLNELSSDDEIRSKFFDETKKFIDDTTIALIGTPAAVHEKEDTLPRFPHILPMNVEHTFFTLLDQKVLQISQRM